MIMPENTKQKLMHPLTIFFGVVVLLGIGIWIYRFGINGSIKAEQNPIPEKMPDIVLLGTSGLTYAGGTTGRNTNIELGVAKLNGTIIAPGEEFSFTKALGEVTEKKGYAEAKMFQDGEVVTGIGGGLCQVSTILFQTVLNAGLPVTERRSHTYAVSYYKTGLDATYSDPGPDLKFINDTGYPITIKGTTENQIAKFEIYGASDGRVAIISDAVVTDETPLPKTKYVYVEKLDSEKPECVNTSEIGFIAKVLYTVTFPNGTKREKTFTSVYRPLAQVCSTTDPLMVRLINLLSNQTL